MVRNIGVILALLASGLAYAQSTDATISGTVTDPAGAVVPGVSVTAENLATGVVNRTTTNASGVYVFPALLPGSYRFSAEMQGFRRGVWNNIALEVGARQTLNMALDLGTTTETVEVQSSTSQLGYSTSSVGNVVSGRQVLELPLAGRSAYDLIATQAGVVGQNFSGNRSGSLNFTIDGLNAQDNLLNGLTNAAIVNRVTVDRAEEFRIITSPADAELGRGSGQVQIVTRSGTNRFAGSLFYEHRNTVLNANTWFNNQRGRDLNGAEISPRNTLIRNQFGGRLGGPIKRNRTFFHVLFDGDQQRQRNATSAIVLTESARRGQFRFFPGVQNANAIARVPTVDLQGNPLRPAGSTGDLQTLNVFGRDPNRLAADPTGAIARILGSVPLPNNYRFGDGLNTAGYTWSRPVRIEYQLFEFRIDHQFSPNHRLTGTFSNQGYDSFNIVGPQPLPDSPGGLGPTNTKQYNLSLISVLRPNLVNEARAGVFRPRNTSIAPFAEEAGGTSLLPTANGIPFILDMLTMTEPVLPTNYASDPSSRMTPVYQYSDTISWLKGKHSFRGGAEIRFVSSAGYDAFAVQPRATVGAGAVPVQNIANVAGIGLNTNLAQSLLLDLSGSIGNAFQTYNSPGGQDLRYISGLSRYRNWRQHEYSFFFKDEWRVAPSLTLNLGVRYEHYRVPYERGQRGVALAGGAGGLFGISGTGFGDMFQPGLMNGSLTRPQLVGPGTPNPDVKFFEQDWNNWSPNVGFAWTLPWFGRNKTVIRAGYGIGYERNPIYLTHDIAGLNPGLSEVGILLSGSLLNLQNLRLPVPQIGEPMGTVPLTQRTQTVRSYDDRLRTPYIQNFNFSITRSIGKDSSFEARYVGSKGTKLIRDVSINEANIFENGILEAYQITQAGGNAALFDRIFMGLGGVNGTTVRGSDLVRSNAAMQAFLSNNNVGGFANFLSSTNQFTGVNGGLLRRVGLPENFVLPNPQFATAILSGNFSNSTYHALQIEFMRRFNRGFFFQGNYTWSKTLGDSEGNDAALFAQFRTLRNRDVDKRRMDFHRTHVWRNNGIYELPFGKDRTFGKGAPGWLNHIIGGWQVGSIFNVFSGEPLSISSVNAFNGFTTAGTYPMAVAPLSSGAGRVTMTPQGPVYFSGWQQVVDPHVARMTTTQGVQQRSTLRAIADENGRLLMVNPQPGELGSLSGRFFESPGSFRLDLNLIKRVRITERIGLQIRADAINFTNSPQWGDPNANINSLDFGRITSADGNRIVVLQARLTF